MVESSCDLERSAESDHIDDDSYPTHMDSITHYSILVFVLFVFF